MLTNNFFFFRMPLKQQQTFFGNITKISQEKTWRRACMESGFGFEFWICHSAKCLQINIFFFNLFERTVCSTRKVLKQRV